ncbi:HEPN domain-containing protein [Actinoallomurus sp. CA-142502]|uniref:HEPN domain-containing protein n=1 Tax=Actinoallomurus sp. CA-142502 TaxID=3239885 RepID=UPI003D92471D
MMLQYSTLAADLDRIRRFLKSGSEEHQTPDQRRFAYIACISALYSSFENFAERLAFRFSEMLLADPSNLSTEQMSSLRRRYVRNASALLSQSLGVGRYREITEFDVAKSLASCLDEATPTFDLRLELIALHNSNLRWDSLPELFQWAVPDLQNKIRNSDAVASWSSRTNNVTESTLMGVLKAELDDLVERRNEVAHRAIPDEIQSYERLLAKVDFIDAISLGLVASLAGPLLDISIKNGETVSLGVPTEYFRSNRVVVIPSLESSVSEGDCIVMPGAKTTRWGRVLEIQLDGNRVRQAHDGMEVGLHLDFAVRKQANLQLWRTPNSDLAFPPDKLFGNRGPLNNATTE